MKPTYTVLAWLGWSAILLMAEVLAIPLVPVAVMYADPSGRLPGWAHWLETHDHPGWEGPLSEGYPAARWGLVLWLWRNRAYRLSNAWRCSPDFATMALRERGTRNPRTNPPAWWLGTIADGRRWWFELTAAARVAGVDVELRAGWKLAPFFEGARPADFAATPIGMQVLSVRTMRAR